jgi:hypothetical protein
MIGEAFSLESLVLPSGIKALCEDQALRSSVLASMPTLDEGGLAVRQLGGDPNRGLQIPGTTLGHQQRTSEGPGEPRPGGPTPGGKGKEKVPVPGHRHKDNVGAAPAQKGDGAPGRHPHGAAKPKGAGPGGSSEATAPWSGSRRPSARRRRGRRSRAELHHLRHHASSRKGARRKRDGLLRGSRLLHHHR